MFQTWIWISFPDKLTFQCLLFFCSHSTQHIRCLKSFLRISSFCQIASTHHKMAATSGNVAGNGCAIIQGFQSYQFLIVREVSCSRSVPCLDTWSQVRLRVPIYSENPSRKLLRLPHAAFLSPELDMIPLSQITEPTSKQRNVFCSMFPLH